MTRFAANAVGSLLRETGTREFAALMRSPVWLGSGVAHGEERPVLLLPGFGLPDTAFLPLTKWLRLRGYWTYRARGGLNVSCSERACLRLEQRLEELVAARGERVAIVGHSRGGVLARALACERPDLVAGIVTLGSPATVAPQGSRADVRAIGALVGSGHLPNLLSWRCVSRTCGTRFRRALAAPFPPETGFTSIYSRSDAVAPWRLCRHPDAAQVEVRASHIGLAFNADAYRAIGSALADLAPPSEHHPSWRERIAGQARDAARATMAR